MGQELHRLPQLRVTVNSRCGRACFFCRPSGEAINTQPHISIDPKAMLYMCSIFYEYGIQSIKLTGGDPALWDSLVWCVDQLKNQIGFQQVDVISRHPRIGILGRPLFDAGVDLLNISLDSLNPEKHRLITGKNDLPELLRAIEQCVKIGIACKINMVVIKGVNDDEIMELIQYCEDSGIKTLKILDMIKDLDSGSESFSNRLNKLSQIGGKTLSDLYTDLDWIYPILEEKATLKKTITQSGLGHPMSSFTMKSGLEVLIKDHQKGSWYGSICKNCKYFPCHDALMAIRLTADLRLQYCLLADEKAIDLSQFYKNCDFEEIDRLVYEALKVYNSASFHGMKSNFSNTIIK